MIISERIFKLLKEKNMMQKDFAAQIGVANSTLSEWKKKKTNPTADKIMIICAVLDVTPEQLLTGKGIDDEEVDTLSHDSLVTPAERQLVSDFHGMQEAQKKRLLAYVEVLKKLEKLEEFN